MKMIIATILLALAAGQANADGFYQQVVSERPQSNQTQEISGAVTETTYTPLYLQVVGNSRDSFNQGKGVIRTPSKTTYTPLYLQVVGHPDKSTSEHPIAGESSVNVDMGS